MSSYVVEVPLFKLLHFTFFHNMLTKAGNDWQRSRYLDLNPTGAIPTFYMLCPIVMSNVMHVQLSCPILLQKPHCSVNVVMSTVVSNVLHNVSPIAVSHYLLIISITSSCILSQEMF